MVIIPTLTTSSSPPTKYLNDVQNLQYQQRNEEETLGDNEEGKKKSLGDAKSSEESTQSEEESRGGEEKKILDNVTSSIESAPSGEASYQHLRIGAQKGAKTKSQDKTQINLDFSSATRRNQYIEGNSVDNVGDKQHPLQNLEIISKIRSRRSCYLNNESSNSVSNNDTPSSISSLLTNESHYDFSLHHTQRQRIHRKSFEAHHHTCSNMHELGLEYKGENLQARRQSARKSYGIPSVIFISSGKHINGTGKDSAWRNDARDMVQNRRGIAESANTKSLDRDKMISNQYRFRSLDIESEFMPLLKSISADDVIVRRSGNIALSTTGILSAPSGTANQAMSRISNKGGIRRRTIKHECKYLAGKMIPGPIRRIKTCIIRKNGSHLKRSNGYLT